MMIKTSNNIIDYFTAHNIVPQKNKLEALLNGHLRLLLFYDPLNPSSEALLQVFLAPLPLEKTARVRMISSAMQLNALLLKAGNFYVQLKSDETGEFISLCASFPTQLPLIALEKTLADYLSIATYQQKIFSNPQKPVAPINTARYL